MALPKSGFNDFSQSADRGPSTPEGGNDMALALTSTVQGQANQLALAAQAAQISIDHASEQLSDYFSGVMNGQALINATLAKTAAKIERQGGAINITADVQPITIELPSLGDFGSTRQRFLGIFGGSSDAIQNPFLAAAQSDEDCVNE